MTVGVVKASAWSGRGEYRGVASNYLAELNTGDAAACFIRTPQSGFQMPDEPETPMIMVGPGTGIAPFRGFIQARSVLKKEGSTLGEALLYFGCRRPDHDDLYREEPGSSGTGRFGHNPPMLLARRKRTKRICPALAQARYAEIDDTH